MHAVVTGVDATVIAGVDATVVTRVFATVVATAVATDERQRRHEAEEHGSTKSGAWVHLDVLDGVSAIEGVAWRRAERKRILLRDVIELTLDASRDADRLAGALVHAVAMQRHGPKVIAHARSQRARAFTLLVRAFDEARRAMRFLRWKKGDADEILPSLYATRRRAKKPEHTAAPAVEGSVASAKTPKKRRRRTKGVKVIVDATA